MNHLSMIRKRVICSGRVQGVGFRYTAQRLAGGFAVAGHVRNLANGNVELVAQGEPAEVDGFLAAITRQMAGYVKGQSIADEAPGECEGFVIRS